METAEMAMIVSQVTEPVLGVTFLPAAEQQTAIGPAWKIAALPINGNTPLTVAVSADEACARILGANMFAAPADGVDDEMMADALCELVNMTAGLLKSAMHLDQPLGLPSMRQADLLSTNDGAWAHHYMRAGELNLVLAVATRIY